MPVSQKISIQGTLGSFSLVAAHKIAPQSDVLFAKSFQEAVQMLRSGITEAAVLPVENSTAGLVQPVWDMLLGLNKGSDLQIVSETQLPIQFVLASPKGDCEGVRKAYTHPVAAAQCSTFIQENEIEIILAPDTGTAAQLSKEQGLPEIGVLCSPAAAKELAIRAENCGNEKNTITKFFEIRLGTPTIKEEHNRTIILLSLENIPGALAEVLMRFKTNALNLCSLHSRGIPGEPGRYLFHAEVEANAKQLPSLEGLATMRILGSLKVAI